ncbi:MAG: recombinase family protein, partial [Clostridia bacterium]|nr:recombinase family protein [Clostridia bacterium]
GNLVVNQSEAVTIRRIYSMFLQGMSPYGIAKVLTSEGIHTPGGKEKWSARSVHSILTNEKYKGDALLQKSYTTDFLTKKKKINEGEIPQYYVTGNHEAIIQPDVFDMVQREMIYRSKDAGKKSGVRLFSGKIKCGHCGEWYGSKVWHSNDPKYRKVVWQCNHKFDGTEKCNSPHLTDDEIERLFISAVNKLIVQRETIISVFTEAMRTALDTTQLESAVSELESEMAVVSDQMQKCIYENARVALDQDEYKRRYDELTARFDTAKARYDEITATIADKQNRKATIEQFLHTLSEQEQMVESFDNNLWCGLVDYVTVYTKEDIRVTFRNGTEILA